MTTDIGNTSDGYHTFNELYEHRHHLFLALMKSHPDISWAAFAHEDGSCYYGWIVAGMHLPNGDISYHLPDKFAETLEKIGIPVATHAGHWDGHTAADVVKRLAAFIEL